MNRGVQEFQAARYREAIAAFERAAAIDPSRAPVGKHIAWGYCHVPGGSTVDMLDRIEA